MNVHFAYLSIYWKLLLLWILKWFFLLGLIQFQFQFQFKHLTEKPFLADHDQLFA